MGNRDHLVKERIIDVNGRETTVHKNKTPKAPKPPKERKAAGLVAPKPAIERLAPLADIVADLPSERPQLQFKPNREWGIAHLNPRNFRIIRGITGLDDTTKLMLVKSLSRDADIDVDSAKKVLRSTFGKFTEVSDGNTPSLDLDEGLHSASNQRYNALTDMSRSERIVKGLVDTINERKAEDDPDVDAEDVQLSIELMRDATSDADIARQVRAYAIRSRRQELLRESARIQEEASQLEDVLRDLAVENMGETYTYHLGGDDDEAFVQFQPRTRFDQRLAAADLSKEEAKLITVKQRDYSLLEKVVGKARYESYRVPTKTAVTIR